MQKEEMQKEEMQKEKIPQNIDVKDLDEKASNARKLTDKRSKYIYHYGR